MIETSNIEIALDLWYSAKNVNNSSWSELDSALALGESDKILLELKANKLLSNLNFEECRKICHLGLQQTGDTSFFEFKLGETAMFQGQYNVALGHLFDALSVSRSNDNHKTECLSLSSIAFIARFASDYNNSRKYSALALEIAEEERITRSSIELIQNDAICAFKEGNNDALALLKKCEALLPENRDKYLETTIIKSFGDCHLAFGELDKAKQHYNKAFLIAEEINHGIISSVLNIRTAKCLMQESSWKTALDVAVSGYNTAENLGFLNGKKEACETLSILYKELGDIEKAFLYLEEFYQLNKIIASSAGLEELAMRDQQLMIEQKESELILLRQIQEKHIQISDSINYAVRIQKSILPESSVFKESFSQHFILYQPKDVVSGDFYWCHRLNSITVLAVADCTGHGVPGAIVSLVCSEALNKVILEGGELDPGTCLNKVREIVKEKFSVGSEKLRDGMDISLAFIDHENSKLSWAGANCPLWLQRVESREIEEYKADKQAIGREVKERPFTTVQMEVEAGDCIYMFSDGYADQFGGLKGKKMMKSNFRRLIETNHQIPFNERGQFLLEKFTEWRNDLEQVDDVCVVGVKI